MTTAARHLEFISCVCVQLDTQTHTYVSRDNITAGATACSPVEEEVAKKSLAFERDASATKCPVFNTEDCGSKEKAPR